MQKQIMINKTINLNILETLKGDEIIILVKLYLDKNYPFNFISLIETKKLLNCSKNKVIYLTKKLEELKLIKKVNSYCVFYEPYKIDQLKEFLEFKLGVNAGFKNGDEV